MTGRPRKPLSEAQRKLLIHFGHGKPDTIPYELRGQAEWGRARDVIRNTRRTAGLANTRGGPKWLYVLTEEGRALLTDPPVSMIVAGLAMMLVAMCSGPADAAEQVALPFTDHALRHAFVVALLALAGAIVVRALTSWRERS